MEEENVDSGIISYSETAELLERIKELKQELEDKNNKIEDLRDSEYLIKENAIDDMVQRMKLEGVFSESFAEWIEQYKKYYL